MAPLRNLTGAPEGQLLVERFTDHLISDLVRHGRGFSLPQTVDAAQSSGNSAEKGEAGTKYLVTGSAQRGRPGGLRVNIRITNAATSEYLWADRCEFSAQELATVQTKIIHQVRRELHILLLQDAIRSALITSAVNTEFDDCISTATAALRGEVKAEPTAEAQRWFLAALGRDPRSVDALVGLARTCQHLISNPWWSDTDTAAIASDLGREVVAIALELAPGHAAAHCVQGMLYSAAGQLDQAAEAFGRALAMDQQLATAHGFAGYNAAFLGSAEGTLPAVERAMRLDRADRRHSIWCFFGGFAELLVGRTEASIAMLQRSLERNPSYGSAQLFLMAALSLSGRGIEASKVASIFQRQYPDCPAGAFEQLWFSRSASATYHAQIRPVFEKIRELGVTS